MMKRLFALHVAFFAFAAFAGTAGAEPQNPPPAFMRSLYPPELVMQHQQEIALEKEQRKAITAAISETQAAVVEIQWELRDLERRIEARFAANPIDEEAALEAIGEVLDLEERVKKAHLRLLIRIHNQLTDAQHAKLDALRAGR